MLLNFTELSGDFPLYIVAGTFALAIVGGTISMIVKDYNDFDE